jgi:hypothetical protein
MWCYEQRHSLVVVEKGEKQIVKANIPEKIKCMQHHAKQTTNNTKPNLTEASVYKKNYSKEKAKVNIRTPMYADRGNGAIQSG